MAGTRAYDHWDLGSNPRSPQNLVTFIFQVFLCSLPKEVHHIPQLSTRQVACKANPVAMSGRSPYSPVKKHVDNHKSQKDLQQLGLENSRNTSKAGASPPGFIPFSSFYIFHLIILLLIIIIIIT